MSGVVSLSEGWAASEEFRSPMSMPTLRSGSTSVGRLLGHDDVRVWIAPRSAGQIDPIVS